MILMRFSVVAIAAGDDVRDRCRCDGITKLALASEPAAGNVSETGNSTSVFRWLPKAAERPWVYIVIHHSGTAGGSVESIHNDHRGRKDAAGNNWLGIGYHFVIGNGTGMEDGRTEATFRWKQQIHGAHAGSAVHNANGIGICLIGDFQKTPPSAKQLESATDLVRQLSRRYQIEGRLILGHKSVKPTFCPGRYFPLQTLITNAIGIER